MHWFQAWRDHRLARRLRQARIAWPLWHRALEAVPLLRSLPAGERCELRILSSLFLHEKALTEAGGMRLEDWQRVVIAAQACLPVLRLGLRWYEGFHEIIVYPAGFVVEHEEVDEAGVVGYRRRALSGESWLRGPVVLAWEDVEHGAREPHDGSNVVIHEFAHKLDMENGAANGMPPLHPDMDRETWTRVMQRAYDHHCALVRRGHAPIIDAYAAEGPGEFFAVISESFFEQPHRLQRHYPAVYAQLVAFYRQDPGAAPWRLL